MPNQWIEIDHPDILIVEGLNVLQAGRPPKDGKAIPFVSDFFDFSVYLDADEDVLREWYVDRFLTLRSTAFRDPMSYFHRYAKLSDAEAIETATSIWTRINLVNLHENILPTRQRADLILKKSANHVVEQVALRNGCSPHRRREKCDRSRRHRLAPRSQRDRLGEPLAVERLHQDLVHAGRQAGLAIFRERVGGERDDRRARAPGPPPRRGCGAWPRCPSSCRHLHVHQHEVVRRAGIAGATPGFHRLRRRSAATVGRWPSLASSERASSALISLSSAIRIDSRLAARRRGTTSRVRRRRTPLEHPVGGASARRAKPRGSA